MQRDFDTAKYKEFRKKVFERDGKVCQMPNCKSKYKSAYLQAHHIRRVSDFPELQYELDHAITLCENCHRAITKFEEEYEEIFYGILRSKKKSFFDILAFKYGHYPETEDGDGTKTEG